MARLRYVDLSGTIAAGNLTNSATTHTFTAPLTYDAGVTVPTLAGSDYFLLSILNTAGTAVSEVVKVTAYNSGTGAATIVRGREGSSGVSHTSGDKVLMGAYPSDLGTETWDDVMSDLSSGMVHRWKFDETSGATIADSVGSLNLTLSGTAGTNYVRNITGPNGLGKACQFISANADSSGLGSLPVTTADRTLGFVFRTTSSARQILFEYGVAAANTIFYADLNSDGNVAALGSIGAAKGGTTELAYLTQQPIWDGDWHVGFIGLRGSGKHRFIYLDGTYGQGSFATAANTTASGNFRISDAGLPFVGDIADLPAWNRALSRAEMDRALNALRGGLL